MNQTIGVCCMLHNIVIDLEEDEGASMPSGQEDIYVGKAWKLADEDAVRVRDALSQHLTGSGGKSTHLLMWSFERELCLLNLFVIPM